MTHGAHAGEQNHHHPIHGFLTPKAARIMTVYDVPSTTVTGRCGILSVMALIFSSVSSSESTTWECMHACAHRVSLRGCACLPACACTVWRPAAAASAKDAESNSTPPAGCALPHHAHVRLLTFACSALTRSHFSTML